MKSSFSFLNYALTVKAEEAHHLNSNISLKAKEFMISLPSEPMKDRSKVRNIAEEQW